MSKISNGSSLQPLAGGDPQQIVLLLHGYGSNGADVVGLAQSWQQALPHALFLAPNAVQRCGPTGFQWWALHAFTPHALAVGAAAAAPALDAFIDRKLSQYGLTESNLALAGFSQGTMLALHIGLRRQRQVAGVLGYSGMLTGEASLAREAASKPPVLLVHGSFDPVVPVAALHAAKAGLERIGVAVRTHISNGIGHSVDQRGMSLGGEFIVEVLGQAKHAADAGERSPDESFGAGRRGA